jgi:ABC-2 type transport system permease protein
MSRRFGRLVARTFGISTSVMLAYRANIVFFLVFETMFLLSQFLAINVGFSLAGGAIAGWSREQVYLLTTVNIVSHQLFLCFFINAIFGVGQQVWNGQFDYILLKPMHPLLSMWVNAQFLVSNLPNLAISLGLLVYLLATGPASPWPLVSAFVLLAVLGVAVRVALALVCMAPVFYSERLADVEDSFWSLSSLGRYPLSVYPRRLELALTFLLPVGMMASLPTSALDGGISLPYAAGCCVAAVAFIALAAWVFLISMRRYQSVNSGV